MLAPKIPTPTATGSAVRMPPTIRNPAAAQPRLMLPPLTASCSLTLRMVREVLFFRMFSFWLFRLFAAD